MIAPVEKFKHQTWGKDSARSHQPQKALKETSREDSYFTQVKCTGTLFDNRCSGEITLSCTHSSTVLPGLPSFHLWLTPFTPESENRL
jgi:hypothetical protein